MTTTNHHQPHMSPLNDFVSDRVLPYIGGMGLFLINYFHLQLWINPAVSTLIFSLLTGFVGALGTYVGTKFATYGWKKIQIAGREIRDEYQDYRRTKAKLPNKKDNREKQNNG